MTRPAAALAAAVAIALVASGCETTQELSAKIGRKLGHQSAVAGTTSLGTANRDVRVARSALVGSGGQYAVALRAHQRRAPQAQSDFPVLIDVLDAKGHPVYRNDTDGDRGLAPAVRAAAGARDRVVG